ncbi:MAG: hypothetical protein EA422_09605 [Gemmatimonadales bacterium]|nr:MAG: hypothetical protein EA422_09605 [Gemmatimonadales bacterium]
MPPGGSDGPWHEREWHHWSERSRVRVCGGCGYRGEGIGYFRRTAHVVLLVGAGILTYGVGALVYWLIKRGDEVCPRCGISWRRSRSLGAELPPAGGSSRGAGGGSHGWLPSGAARHRGPGRVSGGRRETALPSAGGFRGVMGVLLALMALLLLGVGISTAEGMAVVLSLVSGAAGAVSFGSSVKARQGRRAAVLRRAQAQVLELAREQGGVLTATEVASRLDLSLEGAERILLSLDDGFRIRSEVTKEGLLVFEFPEILWRRRGGALERDPEGPGGPDHLGDRIGGSGRLGGSGQDS